MFCHERFSFFHDLPASTALVASQVNESCRVEPRHPPPHSEVLCSLGLPVLSVRTFLRCVTYPDSTEIKVVICILW